MTQFGVWVTNKPVPFQRHRYAMLASDLQEGVVDAGDYDVTQRAAGANMSVDVAVGDAFIQIDSGARNGLAFSYSDALENLAVSASHATLPRIDTVVLQYNDTSIPAGVGGDVPTIRVLAGTPTSGATLDNRNGAVALPADALLLADVLVPAASVTVTNANIRDRRKWARGLFARKYAPTGSNYSTTSGTWVAIDTTNLQIRCELSGAPIEVEVVGVAWNSSGNVRIAWLNETTPREEGAAYIGGTNNTPFHVHGREEAPAAGSKLLKASWHMGVAGTGNIERTGSGGGQNLPGIIVREQVRQSANNE